MALSFNGGKDSTVLLALLEMAIGEKGLNKTKRIISFFFENDDDFEEVRDFTKQSAGTYSIDLLIFRNLAFKEGIQRLISEHEITCILLGTRSTDPNAYDQGAFSPSSPGWPSFMRVNPIIDWDYQDVWSFLLSSNTKYCSLYDEGYTSLGNKLNTIKNVQLLIEKVDEGGVPKYLPAHKLVEGKHEREGRIK